MNFLCTRCEAKIGCDRPQEKLWEGLLCATCETKKQGKPCPEYVESIKLQYCTTCRIEATFHQDGNRYEA